ncbi:fasciclin domain-containing protein [Skermanella sp. TT6]|uniref:Fasciclin domain-containing protein n=1 Tax=Skermanella cutis TaxID=2775420 RepID=A0ABX7BAL1_9PROT|nr:fasciclin domain-containing protein [Skermanella sp. TT6]QQP91432.1 fasciclin domain-containing protein [Skermanella sp. TT6]
MNRLMFGAAIIALTAGTMGSVHAQTSPGSTQDLQPASCTQLEIGQVGNRVDQLQGQQKAEAELMLQRAREAQSDGQLNECRQILADLEQMLPGGQQVTRTTPLPAILGGEGGQGGQGTARNGADPQQAPIQADNVVAALRENRQFSTLVGLIESAGLAETLSQSGPYTIFAPTNAAFEKLPQNVRDQLTQEQNRDQLRTVLSQHVVQNQSIASTQIPQEINAMGGGPIDVSMTNGRPRLSIGAPQPPAQGQTANQTAASQTAASEPAAMSEVRDARTALENANQTLGGEGQEMEAVQDQISTARQALDRGLAQAQQPNRAPLEQASSAIARADQAVQANDRNAARQAVDDALLQLRQAETAMTDGSGAATGGQTDGGQQRTADRSNQDPASITVGDIRTGNGFVHGIDQVLVPENVQEALVQ